MRRYSGRLVVRLPEELHKDLAEESFRQGRSINQLLVESILVRRALRHMDPWPAIHEIQKMGKNLDPADVERDVRSALKDVRRQKQRGVTHG